MTSGRLSDAISHTKRAYECIEARLDVLSSATPKAPVDAKGKGKATESLEEDDVDSLTAAQIQNELKDLKEVQDDLLLKVLNYLPFLIANCQPDLFEDRGAEDVTERCCYRCTRNGCASTR